MLRSMVDNLDTNIYVNDIETGKLLFVNKKMKELFNVHDIGEKTCWGAFQLNLTKQCDFCPVPKLLESGVDYCVWEEHNTLTGRYYQNTDSLIPWFGGKMVHMQHSVDITESRIMEQRLKDAIERSEYASKAKGDFLSRMSHEIRTPLNAIIGMINIAMGSKDSSKVRQCLDRANTASKHLLGLINDILDMSKIEANKFELSIAEFDFEKMLMNVVNVANIRVEEKKQNLVVNLDKNVPACIKGDELRLSQVIMNLLTNAVKFTPENGTIVLRVEKPEEFGDLITLRVEVSDTGIGITEEQQKRLFMSFEQADNSISRQFGGTGLGLPISKHIVELMGGVIWVESESGKGSQFIFTIKVQKGREKLRVALSPKIKRENLRILAVDDSVETRDYFIHVMSALRLPCDVASGGTEALEMIAASAGRPYNIFFVDWQMPGMNGIDLTRQIKKINGEGSIVIMISVNDWNAIEQEAVAAGVDHFVPKPLFPSPLVDVINSCLDHTIKKPAPEAGMPAQKYDFCGRTILIAEDIEINRDIMEALLEETKVRIEFAQNGKIAVSKFTENPGAYDLILMDIQMPEMDGYEATRAIRAFEAEHSQTPRLSESTKDNALEFAKQTPRLSESLKGIPIIAMTANVFREDIEQCLAAGMSDHVGKPVEADILLKKMRKFLPHLKDPAAP
jgi:signal transduction histidine kinase/DNA-binding response OmpR family regulator